MTPATEDSGWSGRSSTLRNYMPGTIPRTDVGNLTLRLTAGARVSGSGQYGERRGRAGLHQLSTPGDGVAGATALGRAGG